MEMTNHEQQAAALFPEWPNDNDFSAKEALDMIAFAAFCLEKQSQQTGFKDANGVPIMYGDTIESFDSQGKLVRHSVEKDPETGLANIRYKKHLVSGLRQNWIDEFKKVIVKP